MIALSALMAGFETKFVRETIERARVVVSTSSGPRRRVRDVALALGRRRGVGRVVAPARPLNRIEAARADERCAHGARRRRRPSRGTSILNFGSREVGAQLVGIDPEQQERVVSTDEFMTEGRLLDLHSASGAIVLGSGLAERLGVKRGDTIGTALRSGGARALRVVGVFHTGIVPIDAVRAYTLVTLAQQLLGLGRDVNRVVLRLHDHREAREVAADVEAMTGYRTESWQEANAKFLSIFTLQKFITYIVTSGI